MFLSDVVLVIKPSPGVHWVLSDDVIKSLLRLKTWFLLFLLFRASKAVVLQLVDLVPLGNERASVRRAQALCGALGGELDLSHTTLDQRTCEALVLMLDHCEGLTELDLSHCRLTDTLLLLLITHLHKVQVLE